MQKGFWTNNFEQHEVSIDTAGLLRTLSMLVAVRSAWSNSVYGTSQITQKETLLLHFLNNVV